MPEGCNSCIEWFLRKLLGIELAVTLQETTEASYILAFFTFLSMRRTIYPVKI